MHTHDAIKARRSVKKFTDRAVTREEFETLLSAAALAPNHKLTLPWRFYVLGPDARYAYGAALGARKAKKIEDPAAATELIDKIGAEHRALPGMLAIAVVNTENAEQREEDYAAAMMAVQNFSLAAVALGLGTHIKTGAVMADPAARAATGVGDDQRIIAIVNVGEPAEVLAPKSRTPASEFTTWVP